MLYPLHKCPDQRCDTVASDSFLLLAYILAKHFVLKGSFTRNAVSR